MRRTALRIPIGPRGLFAAAAVAGSVIYWRASSQRRARRLADAVDDAIAEGRAAAIPPGSGAGSTPDRFDQQ